MQFKQKLEEYTEAEYLGLIERLFQGGFSSEEERDSFVENIARTSEHPYGNGVLYYPEEGVEDSPAGVLNAIKTWRAANNKPGFKADDLS
ncbi:MULTISPECIES: bacteriocin immunity protein [Pseudomonas]|jgi:hypothetical protein|uniref:bacteriocin immunity protein n=1 Tax=Pseudomonas TaxID=286 RepID=UPI000CFFBAF1|nr:MULTISPECIES: bacteriocin immunity protein [Pseudomonas]PRA51755.1 bacteriocin immunity protein [Pseudomonas sp. MYb115]QXN51130.1 bacteriocin immunity protein [Pseudomonas fluorescens]WSO25449.1 bacteriocin immunity protein [Pseudomonas fluorescens]